MTKMKKLRQLRAPLVALLSVAMMFSSAFANTASADTSLVQVKDTLSNSAAGATGVTHTILFTTTTAIGASANNKFTIDFSNGPFAGVAAGNVTVSPSLTGESKSVASNVLTVAFTGALNAATAVSVTVTGTTNPSPGSSTSYKLPIITYSNVAVTVDRASAMVNINSAVTVTLTVQSGLVFTITNSSGTNELAFDLDPAATDEDTAKNTVLLVKTNAKNGFAVTAIANQQLTHTGYSGTTVANSWGGTSTAPSAWASNGGTGFGYSLNGGTTYFTFDTTTQRAVMTSSAPTPNAGQSQTLNYKSEVDWTVPAGIYTATISFIATPTY